MNQQLYLQVFTQKKWKSKQSFVDNCLLQLYLLQSETKSSPKENLQVNELYKKKTVVSPYEYYSAIKSKK